MSSAVHIIKNTATGSPEDSTLLAEASGNSNAASPGMGATVQSKVEMLTADKAGIVGSPLNTSSSSPDLFRSLSPNYHGSIGLKSRQRMQFPGRSSLECEQIQHSESISKIHYRSKSQPAPAPRNLYDMNASVNMGAVDQDESNLKNITSPSRFSIPEFIMSTVNETISSDSCSPIKNKSKMSFKDRQRMKPCRKGASPLRRDRKPMKEGTQMNIALSSTTSANASPLENHASPMASGHTQGNLCDSSMSRSEPSFLRLESSPPLQSVTTVGTSGCSAEVIPTLCAPKFALRNSSPWLHTATGGTDGAYPQATSMLRRSNTEDPVRASLSFSATPPASPTIAPVMSVMKTLFVRRSAPQAVLKRSLERQLPFLDTGSIKTAEHAAGPTRSRSKEGAGRSANRELDHSTEVQIQAPFASVTGSFHSPTRLDTAPGGVGLFKSSHSKDERKKNESSGAFTSSENDSALRRCSEEVSPPVDCVASPFHWKCCHGVGKHDEGCSQRSSSLFSLREKRQADQEDGKELVHSNLFLKASTYSVVAGSVPERGPSTVEVINRRDRGKMLTDYGSITSLLGSSMHRRRQNSSLHQEDKKANVVVRALTQRIQHTGSEGLCKDTYMNDKHSSLSTARISPSNQDTLLDMAAVSLASNPNPFNDSMPTSSQISSQVSQSDALPSMGNSFAAKKDNGRMSSFSSLDFSMKRRKRYRAREARMRHLHVDSKNPTLSNTLTFVTKSFAPGQPRLTEATFLDGESNEEVRGDSSRTGLDEEEFYEALSLAADGKGSALRGVGMCVTPEHVFIPRYEFLEERGGSSEATLKRDHLHDSGPLSSLNRIVYRPNESPSHLIPTSTQGSPRFSPFTARQGSMNSNYKEVGNAGTPMARVIHSSSQMNVDGMCLPVGAGSAGVASILGNTIEHHADGSSTASPIPHSPSCQNHPRGENNSNRLQSAATAPITAGAFYFGSVSDNYNVVPEEEDPNIDCKVAARLVFDAEEGVRLLDPYNEVERYARNNHPQPTHQAQGADKENKEGACECDEAFITKDACGINYSRYHAHELFDHCTLCRRRPAAFLCLHCFQAVCPSHAKNHHARDPSQCTLFLNVLDIMTSFDRIFWCERCKRFTWKYTEVYDPLVDQIAHTRGTYLNSPVRDIHCFGLEARLEPRERKHSDGSGLSPSLTHSFPSKDDKSSVVPVGEAISKLAGISASVQGWRNTQEDAEAAFFINIPALKTTSVSKKECATAHDDEADTIPMAVFCLFDGHGGDAVAKLAATHFESHLHRAITKARKDDLRAHTLLVHLSATSSPQQRPQPAPSRTPSQHASLSPIHRDYLDSNAPCPLLQQLMPSECDVLRPTTHDPHEPPRAPQEHGMGSCGLHTLKVQFEIPTVSSGNWGDRRVGNEVSGNLSTSSAPIITPNPLEPTTVDKTWRQKAAYATSLAPSRGLRHNIKSLQSSNLVKAWVQEAEPAKLEAQNVAPPSAMVTELEVEMLRGYFASVMEDALLSLDDYLYKTPEGVRGDYSCVGCTACVVGITSNFILCANVGDSGAAFYTPNTIESISVKHRLSDVREQARIHAAGYDIREDRIEGMLAVPRALGDFDFKQCGGRGPAEQAVTVVPDVTIRPVPSGAERWGVVVACDGVWDTATLHQVHHALVNTPNDLGVAASAAEAVMRANDFVKQRRRVHANLGVDAASPAKEGSTGTSGELPVCGRERPGCSSTSTANETQKLAESGLGHMSMPDDAVVAYDETQEASAEAVEVAREGSWLADFGGDTWAAEGIDPQLLTAAAGVFAQCVAPKDNVEAVGVDNCSLIIIERRA